MNVYKVLFPLLISCVISVTSGATPRNSTLQRTIYKGECYATGPLSTYDRCEPGSWTGMSAMDCAAQEALNACRSDEAHYNVDCHVVVTSTNLVSSTEFPGWRKCIGLARVHGYERN